MEKEKLEDIAEEILSHEGNVRGTAILSNIEYVRSKKGEEGVRKVEERMEQLGVPLDTKNIHSSEWISVGVSALTVLSIRDVFDWTEEDIFDMGRFAVRISFVTKLFVRYLVSKETVFRESPKYWRKQFDFGSLETKELNDDYAITEIRGHDIHPLICHLRAGYIYGITRFISKGEDVVVEETKCTHRGDDCHQYKVSLR